MKKAWLNNYEEREREIAQRFGPMAAPNGYVERCELIYSDLSLPNHLGYRRAGVTISALLPLYPTTVVYIPPASQSNLRQLFNLDWPVLIDLIDAGIVQPIIGHPTHYANKPHFDALFEHQPPSVWARGDELAHKFAGAGGYWELANRVVQAEVMAEVPWVRQKFRRQFPSLNRSTFVKRVAVELRTNFVDLCIFGWEPLARELAALPDPSVSAREILEVSEAYTYPTLIGMGGRPNYGLRARQSIEAAQSSLASPEGARVISEDIEILGRGLGLSYPTQISAQGLKEFHKDGTASRLWIALERLSESVDKSMDSASIADRATVAQKELTDAMRELRTIEVDKPKSAVHMSTDLALKISSSAAMTVGCHLLGLDWLSSALGGATLYGATSNIKMVEAAYDKVGDKALQWRLRKRLSPLAVSLWWVLGPDSQYTGTRRI